MPETTSINHLTPTEHVYSIVDTDPQLGEALGTVSIQRAGVTLVDSYNAVSNVDPAAETRDRFRTAHLNSFNDLNFVTVSQHRGVAVKESYVTNEIDTDRAYGYTQEALGEIHAGSSSFIVNRVKEIISGQFTYFVTFAVADERGNIRPTVVAALQAGENAVIGRELLSRAGASDLQDMLLSRQHFRVSVNIHNGCFEIKDNGSLNGTAFAVSTHHNPKHFSSDGVNYRYKKEEWALDIEQIKHSRALSNNGRTYALPELKNSHMPSEQHEQSDRDYAGIRELKPAEAEQIVRDAIELYHDTPELSRLFHDPNLGRGIDIHGTKFVFEDIIRANGRDLAVAIVQGNDGKAYPRLYYKSRSDGGWRACPYIYNDGVYNKGSVMEAGGYVWGTKIPEHLAIYLDSMQANQFEPVSNVGFTVDTMRIFAGSSVHERGQETFARETEYVSIDDSLNVYDTVDPGAGFVGDPLEVRAKLQTMVLPEGFMPDFRSVERSYHMEHTLLGNIELTVHAAKYKGTPIEWHVARDSQNRIWVERIAFSDEKITTYGTFSKVLLGGALAMKPLDYRSQTNGMEPNEDYAPFNDHYVDLQPTIRRMPWARAYLKANQK